MYTCLRLSLNEAYFGGNNTKCKERKKEEIGKRHDIIEWNLKEEKC